MKVKLIFEYNNTEDFEEALNKAIEEGWKPLWETFRYSSDASPEGGFDGWCILVVKENEVSKTEV